MTDKAISFFLRAYLALIFVFIFAPIAANIVFSFNSLRFPTIPLGSFSLEWYRMIATDSNIWDAAQRSIIIALSAAVISTAIGFCTAYTDYRFNFFGKGAYMALSLLPPTIPLVIMGLAMLAWLSRIGLSGTIAAVIIAHTVMCIPFATAVIRLRLNQMEPNLEPAAWNLGASEWAAMRTVILPFALPSIISALCLTAAVSFDEFAVAWFVSGLNKTIPVVILEILQGVIDPRINAIGTCVFVTSMTLVIVAQIFFMSRSKKPLETQ